MANDYVDVNFPPVASIEANLGIEPDGEAQAFFTETCATHMDKYVPMRDGTLASTERHTASEIRYGGERAPYAHYMYEGRVMGPNIPVFDKEGNIVRWWSKGPKYYTGKEIEYSTDMHSLAASHWAEKMWSAEKVDVLNEMTDFFKRRG